MATRYLLHFAHEHITFRWPEFLALTSKFGCKFKLVSQCEHINSRPYILIELEDGCGEDTLIDSAKGSYLLKDLYELWAESSTSIEDLSKQAINSKQFQSKIYSQPDQSFRVNCESFGAKTSQEKKCEWIRKMLFLDTFSCRSNLKDPKQVYCIFEMNEKNLMQEILSKEYYFGRRLATSNRHAIKDFSLQTRKFIANTTMDPMLSLIAANVAKVKNNDLVYDPFAGSGGLLIAAAYTGAHVFGADIDWPLLHGKSRPSRKGVKKRSDDEGVRANFEQYQLLDRYIDIMVSDITKSPLLESTRFDSIITDPPYGIRERSEQIGAKRIKPPRDSKKVSSIRYPAKITYQMPDLLSDLLSLSARHLSIGGRLVYYLPVTKSGIANSDVESQIPRHPCLNLLSYSEQSLTDKVSRLMVAMEKIREPTLDEQSTEVISDLNVREVYFSKSDHRGQRDSSGSDSNRARQTVHCP